MGHAQSQQIDPAHVRIYTTLLQVKNLSKQQELLETLLVGPEYIQSAKKAGIYSDILIYVGHLRRGIVPPTGLPGSTNTDAPPSSSQLVTSVSGVAKKMQKQDPMKVVGKQKNSEKAKTFFVTCLRVLDLQEEVAVTEETLKKAYKKKAISAHPDKGGSEEQFESVTRAYAYLMDIVKLVKGQRTKDGEQAPLPALGTIASQRKEATTSFQHVEPIRLDPKNLNMEAFNHMFEKTRIPDPDDDGYGDWLKNEEAKDASAASLKFSGEFNKNVFNRMFEEEAKARASASGISQQLSLLSPQALIMAPSLGLELGREKAQTFTAPANSALHYTDLRHAYTSGATFSGEVAGVTVAPRSIESYKASRKHVELSDEERAGIAAMDMAAIEAEQKRQLRAAHEHVTANDYFERMKRLVIRDN